MVCRASSHWSESINSSRETYKLIFSLYKNDCVSLQLDGEVGVFRLQKISFTNNTVEFVSNLVAKPLKKAQSKKLTLNDENIKEYELKKLRVNILGKIV